MRKLIITLSLVMALAIAAAVSLPVLAADLGTTTISVTIPEGVIDVTAPTAPVDMGEASPTNPGQAGPLTVTVGSNAESWDLRVEDKRTAPPATKGYMDDGVAPTPVKLGLPTEVKGGLVLTWIDLTASRLLQTGGPGTTTVSDINFQQQIQYTDPAGDYSITVTFIGNVLVP